MLKLLLLGFAILIAFVQIAESRVSMQDFEFLNHLGSGRKDSLYLLLNYFTHIIIHIFPCSLESGSVYLVRNIHNGNLYAMKAMLVRDRSNTPQRILEERNVI